MTLPQIFTLHEAAEKLQMKPNALGRLARRQGLCASHGRTLLFSEQDIADVWEVMRVAEKKQIRPAHVSLSSEKAWESLSAMAKQRAINRRRPK